MHICYIYRYISDCGLLATWLLSVVTCSVAGLAADGMKALCALLLTAALAGVQSAHAPERVPSRQKHNETAAVIPAITGIVSPTFFSYASGVAVKASSFLVALRLTGCAVHVCPTKPCFVCMQLVRDRLNKANLGDLETFTDGTSSLQRVLQACECTHATPLQLTCPCAAVPIHASIYASFSAIAAYHIYAYHSMPCTAYHCVYNRDGLPALKAPGAPAQCAPVHCAACQPVPQNLDKQC